MTCSRLPGVGMFVFGVILSGSTSSFGQLPKDTWTPIHHLGRMQGIGWGDGYHSCPTTQSSGATSKNRFRHASSSANTSEPASSSWLPTSAMSTLHSRPSESAASPVPLRFRSDVRSENGGSTHASPEHSSLAFASNEKGSTPGGWLRPAKPAAMEAKCGPLFGFCPENMPLFGQFAPAGTTIPVSQSGLGDPTRKPDSNTQSIQPIESATNGRIPTSR